MEKRKHSYIVDGNVIGASTMENDMEVPQKTRSCHMIQQSHSWVYIPDKATVQKTHALLCSLFTIAKKGKQLNIH